MTVECDNVLLSIGQSIIWGGLLDGTKVELGRGNGAVADPLTYQTAEPDIFVGGDVYTGPKFAIDAITAGKEGAVSIHRFVHDGQSPTIGRNRREFIELDKKNLDIPENRCIGCGVCTTKCEFDAIHLSREIPEASRMMKSEDKMKAILPYAAKRQIKIIRNRK